MSESLTCADLHVVVMGNAVTGLVHTSKLYGILATGIPYVFIGPKASHVADLLSDCPYGYQVEHNQIDELVKVIRKAQAQTPEERHEWELRNNKYVATHYAARISLGMFTKEVIEPIANETHASADLKAVGT